MNIKEYQVEVQHKNGSVSTHTLRVSAEYDLCWIELDGFEGLEKKRYEGPDAFECLISLRRDLETVACKILCAGSRVDVYPSGMCRDMGRGLTAYFLQMGREVMPVRDSVFIFERADESTIGTIDAQKAFYEQWISKMSKQRRHSS